MMLRWAGRLARPNGFGRSAAVAAACALLAALAVLAMSAPRADAACPDPTCGGTITGTGYLRVDKLITGTSTLTQGGTVADNLATHEINCGAGCSSATASSTYVCSAADCTYGSFTLVASDTDGWTFDHWSGCDSPSGSQCTQDAYGTKTSPHVVGAYFRDSAAPTLSFLSGPPAGTTVQGVQSFSATASDNDAVGSVTWTVTHGSGGGQVASGTTASAPYGFSWDTTRSANGSYTVSAYATDASGNRSIVVQRSYTVDNPFPTISVSDAPGAYLRSTAFTFGFSVSPSDATTTCSLDGGAAHACDGTDTVTGLTDGAHTWAVTATEHGGNVTSTSRSFVVDTVAPVVTITGGPDDGAEVHTSDLTFTYVASDANGVTSQCSLDGVARSCTGGRDDLHGVSAASHTWEVTATDAAGNITTVARHFVLAGSGSGSGGGRDTSGSRPACVVPNLRGKTLAQARKKLTRAHCRLGKVTKKASKARSRGHVLGERPGPGKRVAAGTKVAVTVGR